MPKVKRIYDEKGFDQYGYDKDGYDVIGFDKNLFNRAGYHKHTGEKHTKGGKDKDGKRVPDSEFLKMTYRRINGVGYDKDGYDEDGFNRDGYDRNGYNTKGFDKKGYTVNGFDIHGRDKEGYDVYGYDKKKFDREGIHQNGTRYNQKGFDVEGYNADGYNEKGFDRDGYDVEGYDKKGYDKEGYDREGFNDDGYDREGYDKENYNRYGISREGLNRETGERDERIDLVEKYVDSGISKESFCKKNNIDLNEFNKTIDVVLESSSEITKQQIDDLSKQNSAKYYYTMQDVSKKILDGTMDISEYVKTKINFKELINVTEDKESKTKLTQKLFGHMASGKMNLMEYANVLVSKEEQQNYSQLYKNVSKEYDELLKLARNMPEFRKMIPELYNEKKRLGKYSTPYTELTSVGFLDKESGQIKTLEITDEHVEFAKKYIKDSGDYICMSTMNNVFMKIARGEISLEEKTTEKENNIEEQETSKITMEGVKNIAESRITRNITSQNQEIKSNYKELENPEKEVEELENN